MRKQEESGQGCWIVMTLWKIPAPYYTTQTTLTCLARCVRSVNNGF